MCVPSIESQRTDTRALRSGHEFRRCVGSFGEISAHCGSRNAWCYCNFRRRHTHTVALRNCCERATFLESLAKIRIGVAIEIEKSAHRVIARRRHFGRRPRHNRSWPACNERRNRPDRKRLPASNAIGRRQNAPRTIEPTAVAFAWIKQAALEHILPIEMGALAIRRRHRVNDSRLSRLIHSIKIWHRRIERKETVEP